ncbi:hypothetical protein GGR50DRAFT_651156 [Xylaria sp. CBS 124048]|nr:hypothetical protein GGR50DRAFT_651156 [Xylaria sp. CBS 124048]
MVSFFGLKIGGDKKKKASKQSDIPSIQPPTLDEPISLSRDYSDMKPYEGSLYSLSRQESGQSNHSKRSIFKGLKNPFSSNKVSSSMVDLDPPNSPGLRQHASNPSLGRRWNTGSSTSLNFAPPPSFNQMGRPSTSDGERKIRASSDLHSTQDSSMAGLRGSPGSSAAVRDDGRPGTSSSTMAKSPLGQYELKLDLPIDVSSFQDFGDFKFVPDVPVSLRVGGSESTRLPSELQKGAPSPQKPPTPPRSIDDREVLGTPVFEPRPRSAQSHRTNLRVLQKPESVLSGLEPTSSPSPSISPRRSIDKMSIVSSAPRSASRSTKKGSSRIVIRDVHAKRDTLTITPEHRRSLQKMVEAAERDNVPPPPPIDRPSTSSSGRLPERPPLTLNTGFVLSANNPTGPRSAAFLPNPPRVYTPTSMKSPLRTQIRAEERSNDSAPVEKTSDPRFRVDSPTNSSIYNDDDSNDDDYDDDDDEFNRSSSSESTSPVLPLTGPLASPRFLPSFQSPFSVFTPPVNPRMDTIANHIQPSLSPAPPPIPPRSLRRNMRTPTTDSGNHPSPSPAPFAPPLERAFTSPSPVDSRLRSESNASSLYVRDPLEAPRIPISRSGAASPTIRAYRPFTPTTTTTTTTTTTASEFTAPPLTRRQTGGHGFESDSGGHFGSGLRPPPRPARVRPEVSNTPITAAEAQIRDGDLGAEFI